MSLGGFNGALSDRGGSYVTRARTMTMLTVAGALAASLGALVAGHLVPALIATFVVAFAASLMRVWGAQGISIGGATLSVYVVSLAIAPSHFTDAFTRAGYLVGGGLWAMLIALILWPLRPYRPARLAVADCYRALADYTVDVSAAAEAGHTAEWQVVDSPGGATVVRSALETARTVLVQLRLGRPGSAERGERLLVLGEFADQLFGHVVAASELLWSIRGAALNEAIHREAVNTLRQVAATSREIATGVESETERPGVAVRWSGEALRAIMRRLPPGTVNPQYESVAIVLDRAAQFASAASASIEELNGPLAPGSTPALPRAVSAEELKDEGSLREMLRAVFSADSLLVQFALRVAIVTTVAVGFTELLALPRGYWVTITVIVILQPYTGVTLTRAVQRVLGTILGALVAMALGALFHDPRAILVIAFVFVACCVALLPVNYAAYSVFLTPTFVLLAEASAGEWNLAWTRVLDTLLGGALALLGTRLLWPSPERARYPMHAAAALRAVRAYLDQTIDHFDDRTTAASDALRSARRAVGLATINAEESIQRALAEAHGDEGRMAPSLTLLAYIRRLTASIAALAVARHAEHGDTKQLLSAFHDQADDVLENLASSLEAGVAPASLPPVHRASGDETTSLLVRARIERLARQLSTVHDAIRRLNNA